MYLKFQKHISKTDRTERKNYNCVIFIDIYKELLPSNWRVHRNI